MIIIIILNARSFVFLHRDAKVKEENKEPQDLKDSR